MSVDPTVGYFNPGTNSPTVSMQLYYILNGATYSIIANLNYTQDGTVATITNYQIPNTTTQPNFIPGNTYSLEFTTNEFYFDPASSTANTVPFNLTMTVNNGTDNIISYSTTTYPYNGVMLDDPSFPTEFNVPRGNANFSVSVSCLRGNSLVTTLTGLQTIKSVLQNTKILTPEDTYIPIKEIVICWLKESHKDYYHDAIVFEPNSLGPNEPSTKLVIDPGHPICLKDEYLKHGLTALKKAGEYLNNNTIYKIKWNDPSIKDSEDEKINRYDLILEDSYPTYMANNIVIQARKAIKDDTYDHKYGTFV